MLYLLIVSTVFLIYLYATTNTLSILGENVLVKSIKMFMYPFTAFVFYLFIENFLRNKTKNIHILAKQTYFIQIILIIVLILENAQNVDGITVFQSLHSNPGKYWRIRLLTMEASWSGTIVMVFSLLPIYFASKNILKSKKTLIYSTSLLFLLFYTAVNDSKGFTLLLMITLIPSLISLAGKSSSKNVWYLLFIICFILLSFYVRPAVSQVFEKLYVSQTFGTRLTSYLAALYHFLIHPFGVGLGPYLLYYTESIKTILETGLFNELNLREISSYTNSSHALSTKTYFFDQLTFGGIGFLWFFINFFLLRLKRLKRGFTNYILKIALIFVLLSGMTFVNFGIKYEVWLLLAIASFVESKKN
jgi:hypothetical protein